jgi:hypothetical protein
LPVLWEKWLNSDGRQGGFGPWWLIDFAVGLF